MSVDSDVRWRQRFQNFDPAFVLLREAMENGPAALNPLEKEGVIQRFEYCFELAWKLVKDYMESGGYVFEQITPGRVLRDAFGARVIADGEVWIEMMHQRNLLSHTYDFRVFDGAVSAIHARYLAVIGNLHAYFQQEAVK